MVSNRRPDAEWSGPLGQEDLSLVEQIKSLADALSGTSVTDLEMSMGEMTIALRRQPPQVTPMVTVSSGPMAPATPPTRAVEPPIAPADMTVAVLAPITGVFYTSSSPSAPSFVQVGDHVQAGQVVCLVEAMKVFNEIKTEIGGTVVALPPKNGQLVKKGDPLVRIKPI